LLVAAAAAVIGSALAQPAFAAPPNDNLANAEAPGDHPRWFVIRSNVDATAEPGEPLHAGQPGSTSVWFSWEAPASGPVQLDVVDTEFDSLLAVYTGSEVAALTPVASDDDSGGGGTSTLTFSAQTGTRYRIAVAGKNDASGRFVLALTSLTPGSPANDDFAAAQTLAGSSGSVAGTNVSATREFAEPYHFPDHWGGASVWYRWTAPASGTVSFRRQNGEPDDEFYMAAYSGASLGSLVQLEWDHRIEEDEIVFQVTGGVTYSIAVDGWDLGIFTDTGPFTLSWQLYEPPTNDAFAAAEELPGRVGEVLRSNAGATKEALEPHHGANPTEEEDASVWFSWTAQESGPARFDLWMEPVSRVGYSPILAVYQGAEVAGLTRLGTRSSGGLTPVTSIAFDAVAGTTYRIAVAGRYGTIGDFRLRWKPNSPANDYFYQAELLSGVVADRTVDNMWAGKEPEEPDHAQNPGGASVWYRYSPPSLGRVTVRATGDGIPLTLAAYSGTQLRELDVIAADAAPDGSAEISFANGPPTVQIAVDALADENGGTSRGPLNVHVRFSPSNDDFADATVIQGEHGIELSTLVGGTAEPGEPAHVGNSAASSIWYRWTAPDTPTRTVELQVSNTAPGSRVAVYTGGAFPTLVPIAGKDTRDPDGVIRLSFRTVPGTEYRFAVDGALDVQTQALSFSWSTPVDSSAPDVTLVSPAQGTAVSGPVELAALAEDDYGVAEVEFLVDDVVVGSDSTEPFALTWDPTSRPEGPAVVRARARDTSGLETVSTARTLVVDRTPPAVTSPRARLVLGSRLGATNVPLLVSWSAVDATSGIRRYRLARSSGGAWSSVPVAASATKALLMLPPGRSHSFRASAEDRAGNVGTGTSAALPLRAHQETAGAFGYVGVWRRELMAGAYGGRVKHSSSRGARARCSFTGRQVALAMALTPGSGKAAVYVDGAYVKTVDLFARSRVMRKLVFTRSWPTVAPHVVTVRVLGSKRAASSGKRVAVDACVVLG
jgi:Bacterial Ig domain